MQIDVTVDCELREYIESHKKLIYKPGCTFFEFKSDKEDISERMEMLLLDKVIIFHKGVSYYIIVYLLYIAYQ